MRFITTLILCIGILTYGNTQTVKPGEFSRVVISPFIEVNFQKGAKEEIIIHSNTENEAKLHMEVKGRTLHMYLDGAATSKNAIKDIFNEIEDYGDFYDGTVVKATIIYRDLEEVSVRGDEDFIFESPIKQDEFDISIYGESRVVFSDIEIDDFKATMYGECKLTLEKGDIYEQKYVLYGESHVDASAIDNDISRIKVYGDGDYRLHVEEKLVVTSFGEANIRYSGSPEIKKNIDFGESTLEKVDRW